MIYIDNQTNHQLALETQGTQCSYTNTSCFGNHIESGQHKAMLFTVWLNPQIGLITAIMANKQVPKQD